MKSGWINEGPCFHFPSYMNPSGNLFVQLPKQSQHRIAPHHLHCQQSGSRHLPAGQVLADSFLRILYFVDSCSSLTTPSEDDKFKNRKEIESILWSPWHSGQIPNPFYSPQSYGLPTPLPSPSYHLSSSLTSVSLVNSTSATIAPLPYPRSTRHPLM